MPSGIRFEYANSSDGFYEPESSNTTVRVALNNKKDLPRRPTTHFVASDAPKNLEVVKLQIKTVPLPQEVNRPIKVKYNSSKLNSEIWFMLNLENASMGQIQKIPTSWFVQMLKDTRDIETNSPGRLIKGRKVLIEKLLSRLGSFDREVMEGIRIKALLRQSEAKDYKIQSVASD